MKMQVFYAITDVGPFRKGQVIVLEPDDLGWANTGYFRELIDPAPGRPVTDCESTVEDRTT